MPYPFDPLTTEDKMSTMGIKQGTKTWSEAPQNEIQKRSSGANNLSANQELPMGAEDIGEALNKLADPNWTDPRKKIRTVGSDKMDKDAFMKLMLAQMKNQDPTNPLKSHEMAAQLAQFTGVEQMQNINTTLSEMRSAQKPLESFQALNFIGKAVSGDSARLTRSKGDTSHEFNFELPENASEVKILVKNERGEMVRKVDMQNLKKGNNTWNWNGEDERGQQAPVGEYTYQIEAKTPSKKLNVKTAFDGVITGVNYSADGPVLLVGNQTVKLKDVKKIVDPSLTKNDQIKQNNVLPDLKNQQGAAKNNIKGEEKVNAGAPERVAEPSLIDNVALSQDMIKRLEKETKPDQPKEQVKVANR